MGGEKMEERAQAVLKAIEDNPHRYQHLLARWGLQMAIQELSPKGVLPHTLVEGVLETLYAQTKEALGGLWEVLGVPPPSDLEERLRKSGLSHAFGDEPLEGFSLYAVPGVVALDGPSGLHVVNDKAFLRTSSRKPLERVREGVRALRPLLTAMGLSDLEGAIEALLGLEEGEGRVEGGYVLTRSGGFWSLWRGTFLGNPDLDVAVLAGRDAVLPLPEGVAFSFRVRLMCARVYVDRLGIYWKGDGRYIESDLTPPEHLFERDSVVRALRQELGRRLDLARCGRKNPFEGLPLSALGRLREFAHSEDPSAALRRLLQSSVG
jgi:hypothetical protein